MRNVAEYVTYTSVSVGQVGGRTFVVGLALIGPYVGSDWVPYVFDHDRGLPPASKALDFTFNAD